MSKNLRGRGTRQSSGDFVLKKSLGFNDNLLGYLYFDMWFGKKSFFHNFFVYYWKFDTKKRWFLTFFGTLQNFASFLKTNFFKFFSKKKSVHSPHLSWKISVFWNSQLKSFWHFLKKNRFFNFFIPMGKPWKRTTKKSNFWCFSYQSKIYIRYNMGDLMRSCFSMNVLYYWKIGLDQYQILWNYEMSQKPLSQ